MSVVTMNHARAHAKAHKQNLDTAEALHKAGEEVRLEMPGRFSESTATLVKEEALEVDLSPGSSSTFKVQQLPDLLKTLKTVDEVEAFVGKDTRRGAIDASTIRITEILTEDGEE